MTVCRFWEKGNCRNGNNCRFEHPGARQQGGNPFGGGGGNESRSQPRNPFGARDDAPRGPRGGDSYRPEPQRFNNDRGRNDDRSRGFGAHSGGHASGSERNYRLDPEAIRQDLTTELPSYPFSNYCPAGTIDSPKHLFDPQMEVSPEELRMKYYLTRMQGGEGQAQAEETTLVQAAQSEIAKVLGDIHGAIKMVAAAKREHPNRWDIVDQNKGSGNPNPFQPARMPFSGPSGAPSASGFGQPSAVGQGAGGFGQPSAVGQGAGGFGQPSQLGQQSSGFGQPSQMGQAQSGFGQPSALGQRAGFGQPSQGSGQNPFGQPSQGGGQSPFGQPTQQQAPSAFGQPSGLGARPAFGQPSNAGGFTNQANPFGQASAQSASGLGQGIQQRPQANPFGQPSGQSSGGFGQPQLQASNGFGQPSGGLEQPAGGFGQPAQPSSNGFGQGTQQTNGFGQLNSGVGQQKSGGFDQQNGLAQPQLQIKTAQPVMNGASYTTNPPSANPRDADPPEEMYGSKKGEFEEAYKHILTAGTFADGIMPEIAPQHHWIGWGPMERRFQT